MTLVGDDHRSISWGLQLVKSQRVHDGNDYIVGSESGKFAVADKAERYRGKVPADMTCPLMKEFDSRNNDERLTTRRHCFSDCRHPHHRFAGTCNGLYDAT